MAAEYPGAVATTPTRDDADMSAAVSHKTNHDRIWEEIRAIQQTLATSPTRSLTALGAAVPASNTTWSSPIASGITIGNGTAVGRHVKIGTLQFCWFRFTQGSSGGVTGDVTLTLPSSIASAPTLISGSGRASIGGAGFLVAVTGGTSTTVNLRPVRHDADAQWTTVHTAFSASEPATWGSGDVLFASFWYFDGV